MLKLLQQSSLLSPSGQSAILSFFFGKGWGGGGVAVEFRTFASTLFTS